jgi:hypothetical protein
LEIPNPQPTQDAREDLKPLTIILYRYGVVSLAQACDSKAEHIRGAITGRDVTWLRTSNHNKPKNPRNRNQFFGIPLTDLDVSAELCHVFPNQSNKP